MNEQSDNRKRNSSGGCVKAKREHAIQQAERRRDTPVAATQRALGDAEIHTPHCTARTTRRLRGRASRAEGGGSGMEGERDSSRAPHTETHHPTPPVEVDVRRSCEHILASEASTFAHIAIQRQKRERIS